MGIKNQTLIDVNKCHVLQPKPNLLQQRPLSPRVVRDECYSKCGESLPLGMINEPNYTNIYL